MAVSNEHNDVFINISDQLEHVLGFNNSILIHGKNFLSSLSENNDVNTAVFFRFLRVLLVYALCLAGCSLYRILSLYF